MMYDARKRRTPLPSPASTTAPAKSGARTQLQGRSLREQQDLLRPGANGFDVRSAALKPATAPPAQTQAPKQQGATPERAQAAAAQAAAHQEQAEAATGGLLDELAGWADFALTALKYVKVDGMFDRAREVARIVGEVGGGADVAALGIDPNDHRLRNVAEMQSVIDARRGRAEGPIAADGLRDANAAFYVLMGNNAGRFDGIDMARYRRIGALGVDEAAKVLPDFEADLFAAQSDPATIEFGNSLSPKHRRELFQAYNAAKALVDRGGRALDRLGDAAEKATAWARDLMGL